MNLTQFRAEVAAKLGLNISDATELALIDQWINDGVVEVVSETKSKVAAATAAITAGTADYTLDTAILRILWIQNADGYELEPAAPDDILRRRLNATADVTRRYAVDGANMLLLYPTPAATSTLSIRYVPRPVTLAAGGDTPTEIPAEHHRAVTWYALWQGADYDDDQSSAQGARYQQLFEQELARMRARLQKKRGRRLPRAQVAPVTRVPSRNDIV